METSARLCFFHNNLGIYSLLELLYMGDDAHRSARGADAGQAIHGFIQGVLIQGGKALIDKDGFQGDPPGSRLDNI